MKINKILVPIDFSEFSQLALQHATAIARDSGATLLIVHVHDPLAEPGEHARFPIDLDEAALLSDLGKVTPPDDGVNFHRKLLHGNPANEILRFATDEHIDMIVMGTHGRRGVMRLLLGSVAEAVLRDARCPVLTVKKVVNPVVDPADPRAKPANN